ncbi:hypothetical protein COV12_01725 [Candidatus Woesearchaeota archaeon CG10_big_fil_rev_8_21_14_0_10_32_24]|nr:MAG: hypothetical protein COV12_01725 [Candidatus Woesearchaeota archaeon CG10_big_fil_rev_8_21_14_0_10_32_24]PIZ74062.1 MAG: hypothetical protein COY06_04715 [Candidatus Peregrinibacteria bacterium CG_4_10_14_0_2_um_filter_41_8]
MCKIYVDTNVYMDLFGGRKDRFRDLAQFAANLFYRVREGEFKLVVSDWVIEEFSKHMDPKLINELLNDLTENQLRRITKTSQDKKEARELSSTNYPDALHVILAKKADAMYLVTRNIQDFADWTNLIEIVMPDEI